MEYNFIKTRRLCGNQMGYIPVQGNRLHLGGPIKMKIKHNHPAYGNKQEKQETYRQSFLKLYQTASAAEKGKPQGSPMNSV